VRALVTGANGFIGAHLVRGLLDQGYQVRAFVRTTSDLRSLEGVQVEKVYGDILEVNTLINAARGCDVLFHVAAIFSYSKQPDELMAVARTGTINAVEAAKAAGIRRIVLTSSSVIFGSTTAPTPLDESERTPEPDPAPYVVAKIAQEQAGFRRAAELGIDMLAACPTICIGSRDYGLTESNAIVVNYLLDPFKATWPGGCNIVSVRDVVQGHILIAERGEPGGRYLLGAENLHWSAIHSMISELCGIEGPLMTANHTSCYLAALAQEIASLFTNKRPIVTRAQAKMVGRYYWYRHDRAARLGYTPMPARSALVRAISWLVASEHVPHSVRSTIRLSQEVYDQRQRPDD
jgi:dihydroflavonol-4-reductase